MYIYTSPPWELPFNTEVDKTITKDSPRGKGNQEAQLLIEAH